jgi:hypothetical protein
MWSLKAHIIDIETAFLHGNLNESIYMLAPKGSKINGATHCVHLDKALYGLVQAARQFYLKFSEVLKAINFKVSYADPCLFFRKDKYGIILMVIHIDDCYVVGKEESLKLLNQQLHQQGLKTKVSPDAKDYLSCEIKMSNSGHCAHISQPTLMKKMLHKYEGILNQFGNFKYRTPWTPGFNFIKPEITDKNCLTVGDQTRYRSGIGTLLQFSNKTRPDITNVVRELSRGMDRASYEAEKEMFRVMKYLQQTQDFGLKLQPSKTLEKGLWKLHLFSDSDWASNKQDRKSITGFSIFFQDAPIFWKSQAQKTVSLSSTEAEYYATSEAAKELKFIVQVLESLNIKIKKPIILFMDNIGAMFVAENPSATKHTRHIDARYHFIREYIIEGSLKIIFVNSLQNQADLFTKNVHGEVHDAHVGNYIIRHDVLNLTSKELEDIDTGYDNSDFDSGGGVRDGRCW